ncbi:MAG: class I SAM-dependent methyltransferase [Chloroflexi bacterium]|nr:class I SAM-dependent methyltransferase [Chloroflexota bacterium]
MAHSDKAALRGEPGYVWRSGQERRLGMVREWAELANGRILDNGCGLGTWLDAFGRYTPHTFGLEVELERAQKAIPTAEGIVQAVGETLPFASHSFDFVFSNEVIEHVGDDVLCMAEMVRWCGAAARYLWSFAQPLVSRRTTWGVMRGRYKFSNIPLVNYLPLPSPNSRPMCAPIRAGICAASTPICPCASCSTAASLVAMTTSKPAGQHSAVG